MDFIPVLTLKIGKRTYWFNGPTQDPVHRSQGKTQQEFDDHGDPIWLSRKEFFR
jgi:hypothetical protein